MSSDGDIILSYLQRRGWRAERSGDGWRLVHADRPGALSIGFTPSWICLGMALASDGALEAGLARRLLECNEAQFLAKFAQHAGGTLALQAELPAAGSLHRLDAAIEALQHCYALYAAALTDPTAPDAGDRAAQERYFEQPPGIPTEVLAYYMRAVEPRGWWLRGKARGVTWPLVYKGQRLFPAYLTLTRAWAYLQVVVLPEAPVLAPQVDDALRLAFLDYLLRVNDAWFMAKVGLDDAGRVLAMVEVPTLELDFETFRKATALLATYLDLYAREIQIMAHLTTDARLAERVVTD